MSSPLHKIKMTLLRIRYSFYHVHLIMLGSYLKNLSSFLCDCYGFLFFQIAHCPFHFDFSFANESFRNLHCVVFLVESVVSLVNSYFSYGFLLLFRRKIKFLVLFSWRIERCVISADFNGSKNGHSKQVNQVSSV